MDDERGRLEWPVTGWPITQVFGVNAAAYARFGLAGHAGVDFGCTVGTPVRAVRDGTVRVVTVQAGGFGLYVRVDHGCFDAYYAHLHSVDVTPGDPVQARHVLGYSGGAAGDPYAGNSTGAHLHFEMRPIYGGLKEFGGAIDPMPYFDTQADAPKKKVLAFWALTVRAGPGVQYRAVRYVKHGDIVHVYKRYDGWSKISSTADEWVSERYLGDILS